jgi:hypothetical protein
MIFTVNRNWPLPDNFFTGNLLNLYSTRLIEILADQGVKFETFPATLIDRKTEVALPISYEVFHLLERHPCIDKERSPTSGPLAVAEQVVLTEECMERQKLFFRAEEASELVFIHQRLKTILEDAGITGCRYITLDEYLKQAPIYLV